MPQEVLAWGGKESWLLLDHGTGGWLSADQLRGPFFSHKPQKRSARDVLLATARAAAPREMAIPQLCDQLDLGNQP